MNVLILTPLYPPAVGGAATYFGDVVPLLAQFSDIGNLIVLTEKLPGQPRETVTGKLKIFRYLPARVSQPQKSWMRHVSSYILTQLWFVIYLPALLRRHDIGLLHFHTRYRGRLFFGTLRRCHIPIVADLRDKMAVPQQLAKVASRLMCCGESVWQFATDGGFPKHKTALIPIPFQPPPRLDRKIVHEIVQGYKVDQSPYVLFVGDITHNKGVWDLLDAFQNRDASLPDMQLVLAGINREGPHFLQRLQQIPDVTYLGHVSRSDVLALMQGAEIVALPSRSEGLPRVILEALAMGTKVICPPDIPEFERYLAPYALSEVSAGSILTLICQVWYAKEVPSYPFSTHQITQIVDQIMTVYRDLSKNQTSFLA